MRFFFRTLIAVSVLGSAFSSSLSYAQSCGSIVSTSTSSFPTGTHIVVGMRKESGPGNGIVVPTIIGAVRIDPSSSPGSPSTRLFELGSLGGGPIQIAGDTWQGVTAGSGYSDSGGGRIAVNWIANGAGTPGDVLGLGAGNSLQFGQQLDPLNGSATRSSQVAVAKTSSGSYFAYFSASDGLHAVNVTSLSGSPASSPLSGTLVNSSWTSSNVMVVGNQTTTPYIFALVGGSLRVGAVSGTGGVTEVASYSFSGLKSLDISYQNGVYWVFLNEFPANIEVLEFNPGSSGLSHLANIPSTVISSGVYKAYSAFFVRGGSSPVLIGRAVNSSNTSKLLGYDLVGVGGAGSGFSGGSPAIINIPNVVENGVITEAIYFEGYVSGSTAYLYRVLTGAEPRLRTDAINVSCIQAGQNSPPTAGLSVQNISAHVGADPTNYVGDKFKITDTSVSSAPITANFWDMDFTGTFQIDANLTSSTFNAYLPCKPSSGDPLTGIGCYNASSPDTSETIANQTQNTYGVSTNVGSQPITLAKPLTKVANFTSGKVNLFTGQSIDATVSQGSPVSCDWVINDGSTQSAKPCTWSSFADGNTFSVAANYTGGYKAAAVTGTVNVTSIIPNFTVPATIQLNQTFSVKNICQLASGVSITGINYLVDNNPTGDATSGTPLPGAFDSINATTSLPGESTAGTYYAHFHITYSGGTGTSINWDSGAINATNVTYNPAINFPDLTPGLGSPVWTASTNTSLSVMDSGDASKPDTADTWNFGDGTAAVNSTTTSQSVAHTYTKTGTFTVTLTVGSKVGDDEHQDHVVGSAAAAAPTAAAAPAASSTAGWRRSMLLGLDFGPGVGQHRGRDDLDGERVGLQPQLLQLDLVRQHAESDGRPGRHVGHPDVQHAEPDRDADPQRFGLRAVLFGDETGLYRGRRAAPAASSAAHRGAFGGLHGQGATSASSAEPILRRRATSSRSRVRRRRTARPSPGPLAMAPRDGRRGHPCLQRSRNVPGHPTVRIASAVATRAQRSP